MSRPPGQESAAEGVAGPDRVDDRHGWHVDPDRQASREGVGGSRAVGEQHQRRARMTRVVIDHDVDERLASDGDHARRRCRLPPRHRTYAQLVP
jgi:hypothetical protein